MSAFASFLSVHTFSYLHNLEISIGTVWIYPFSFMYSFLPCLFACSSASLCYLISFHFNLPNVYLVHFAYLELFTPHISLSHSVFLSPRQLLSLDHFIYIVFICTPSLSIPSYFFTGPCPLPFSSRFYISIFICIPPLFLSFCSSPH